jgi:hypothetical protein
MVHDALRDEHFLALGAGLGIINNIGRDATIFVSLALLNSERSLLSFERFMD